MPRECTPGLFGIKRAHRFVGCYDKSEPASSPVSGTDYMFWSAAANRTISIPTKRSTYVRHVCTRCGERIERNKP